MRAIRFQIDRYKKEIGENPLEDSTTRRDDATTSTITVCVGSSCHLRGSYEIIAFLKELLRIHRLEQRVLLKGSFCMEKCSEGVNVKVNEEVFSVASTDEMNEIFRSRVLVPVRCSEAAGPERDGEIHSRL